MYLKKHEMVLAIKEAVRMVKPGGSLCFSLNKRLNSIDAYSDRIKTATKLEECGAYDVVHRE